MTAELLGELRKIHKSVRFGLSHARIVLKPLLTEALPTFRLRDSKPLLVERFASATSAAGGITVTLKTIASATLPAHFTLKETRL